MTPLVVLDCSFLVFLAGLTCARGKKQLEIFGDRNLSSMVNISYATIEMSLILNSAIIFTQLNSYHLSVCVSRYSTNIQF